MITRIKTAMIGQRRNLRALAGICEFQEVVIERKSATATFAHFNRLFQMSLSSRIKFNATYQEGIMFYYSLLTTLNKSLRTSKD